MVNVEGVKMESSHFLNSGPRKDSLGKGETTVGENDP